ncbi:DUF2254 domain-containing protein [Acuticoccus kandeliae]|uniref:DUF2254 domain-containing protein n=1 Tax=Acuticoccus kandeliae TaxID=2073160 RepID=UPI0013002AB8|nr:DUF2254 domain-containing protein [Acuticoccus kandeliae]
MRTLFIESALALRQSYWFWPSVLTALALVAGFTLPIVDVRLGTGWMDAVGFLRPMQVDGARGILTTLASAVLGVAGVSFSITMVAVTFASGNYGPRLIGNFMRDRTNQVVLGIFLATFVYCIAVLSTIHAESGVDDDIIAAFVPQISILVAMMLTLASVGALIVYIHHVPESINIMNLVAKIGAELEAAVVATALAQAKRDEDAAEPDIAPWHTHSAAIGDSAASIASGRTGYIQWVDLDTLTAKAREAKGQVVLVRTPGDFVVEGETIMTARPASHFDEACREALGRAVTFGTNRTELQDVLFLSDELVEVLERALSPGVNDPNTAMLCLDWLRAGLSAFARQGETADVSPLSAVLYTRVSFETMLARSLSQMRQYIAADRNVTVHAIAMLADLADDVHGAKRLQAIDHEAETLAMSAQERLDESAARQDVETALANYRARRERRLAGITAPTTP